MKKVGKAVMLVNRKSEDSSFDEKYSFTRSMSDSGFNSSESVKPRFRKYSVAPAPEKPRLDHVRREKFRRMAEETRKSSENISKKFEIPDKKFSNFTNITGKKVKKKVFKQEKVTLQSIMSRSWNEIISNIEST